MNSLVGKIATVVISLILLSYVGYQAFASLYDPYEAEVVKLETYVQDVDLNGFFVRDEQVLSEEKTGAINYRYENAEKISRSAVVADVYAKESDLYNLRRLNDLKNQKAIIEESQDRHNIEGLKIDALNAQVIQSKNELLQVLDNEELYRLNSVADNLLLSMNKASIGLNDSLSYDSTIASLEAQIGATESQISRDVVTITSADSGYFSNIVDGYESEFVPDMLKSLSIKSVKNCLSNKKTQASNSIGKVINSSDWSFVALISAKDGELFQKGQDIRIVFNSKTKKEVVMNVSQIISEKGIDESIIVFSCGILDADFATMRFEKPKAIINSYKGIVIPKEAIRIEKSSETVVNEETGEETIVEKDAKGVYSLLGKTARFKQIDVLYEDSYYVVSNVTNNSNYVSVYDKVITKGKDLNDTIR